MGKQREQLEAEGICWFCRCQRGPQGWDHNNGDCIKALGLRMLEMQAKIDELTAALAKVTP